MVVGSDVNKRTEDAVAMMLLTPDHGLCSVADKKYSAEKNPVFSDQNGGGARIASESHVQQNDVAAAASACAEISLQTPLRGAMTALPVRYDLDQTSRVETIYEALTRLGIIKDPQHQQDDVGKTENNFQHEDHADLEQRQQPQELPASSSSQRGDSPGSRFRRKDQEQMTPSATSSGSISSRGGSTSSASRVHSPNNPTTCCHEKTAEEGLRILILGADGTGEGSTIPEVKRVFRALGQKLFDNGHARGSTAKVELMFVGPNVPRNLSRVKRHAFKFMNTTQQVADGSRKAPWWSGTFKIDNKFTILEDTTTPSTRTKGQTQGGNLNNNTKQVSYLLTGNGLYLQTSSPSSIEAAAQSKLKVEQENTTPTNVVREITPPDHHELEILDDERLAFSSAPTSSLEGSSPSTSLGGNDTKTATNYITPTSSTSISATTERGKERLSTSATSSTSAEQKVQDEQERYTRTSNSTTTSSTTMSPSVSKNITSAASLLPPATSSPPGSENACTSMNRTRSASGTETTEPPVPVVVEQEASREQVEMAFVWKRGLLHDLLYSVMCTTQKGDEEALVLRVGEDEHEYVPLTAFDCAFAFNAGIWGYDSWLDTFEVLPKHLPIVITGYSIDEVEHDKETIEERFGSVAQQEVEEQNNSDEATSSTSSSRVMNNRTRSTSCMKLTSSIFSSSSKLGFCWGVEANPNAGGNERVADYGNGPVGMLRDNAAWFCFVMEAEEA
ncbi:unnamed protein product [Amoebophrya sp. A25]|nr:unnamed protein product [Amoebophrya sp. A25]|eukprot:GSA25T00021664001.1